MPRLLMVSTYPLTIQTFLLPYARHFRAKGWRVDAAASGDLTGVAPAFDQTFSIDWSRDLSHPSTWFRAPRKLRAIVGYNLYDIVHVHTPVASFATRFALRGLRRGGAPKLVYTAHGFHFDARRNPVRNAPFIAAEMLAGRWTDHLVVMNGEDEAAARRYRIVSESRLRRMPGIGVDLSTYASTASTEQITAIRRELGLSDHPYLLCVAEFRAVKRHDLLLRAFARTLQTTRSVLLLAGSGPLQPDMERLAAELGIEESVRFLGFRQDIPVLLRGAAGVVLASEREGLPRCILEAMVARIPVVATAARGTTDLLSGGLGELVPLGDASALGRAMAAVLSDRDTALDRAARAAATVSSYDLRHLLAAHEALYQEALGTSRAAAPAVAA